MCVIRAALDDLALNVSGVNCDDPDYLRKAVNAFCPAYIVIDASKAETGAVETCTWGRHGNGERGDVPRTKVIYCTWHVKRAIIKNLHLKLQNKSLFGTVWLHVEALLGIKARQSVMTYPHNVLT